MAHSTCYPFIFDSRFKMSKGTVGGFQGWGGVQEYDPATGIQTVKWYIRWACGGYCPINENSGIRPPCSGGGDTYIDIPIDLANDLNIPKDIIDQLNELATAPPVMEGSKPGEWGSNHHGGMSPSHKAYWDFKAKHIDDALLKYLFGDNGIKATEDKFIKGLHDRGICACQGDGVSKQLKMAKSIADKISGDAMKRALSDY
tara:strand:- start:715 stop:1317 length:603 start_codon:yes stop_codon:yes gene_type:complete